MIFLSFLFFIILLIGVISIPDSFGVCLFYENGTRIEPCGGLPLPNEGPSLKEQVNNNEPVGRINCPDYNHVLTERPNGKLACVYVTTAEKLNWTIIK